MDYNFKHYLVFNDLPNIGTIQISEPFGFDGSTHKVKQDDKRDGRDVIIADESIEFEFTREEFEKLNTPQQLINGTNINNASQGYDYIIDCLRNEGWELGIDWIIEKNGTQFVKGSFDGFTAIIGNDSIKFKVVQDTKRELVKRRDDIFVDAFSDKDLDGNSITPCSTTDILLKAKPIIQNSEFQLPAPTTLNFTDNYFLVGGKFNFNIINQVNSYNIENTLSFIQGYVIDASDCGYIYAINTLNNVVIDFKDISFRLQALPNISIFPNNLNDMSLRAYYYIGDTFTYSDKITLLNQNLSGLVQTVTLNTQVNTSIQIGQRLFIWFELHGTPHSIFPLRPFKMYSLSGKINISATSTAISSVIKGVRLTDLFKNNIKSISGLPLEDSVYGFGTEHYNNFAFNGYLLGQKTDKPFNNKFKDLMGVLPELNADYQINPDKVEILPYSGFYTNNEIFSSLELPDHESTSKFNKKHFIKSFECSFKKSSNQRETNGINTIDDVHGKTQWTTPSRPNRNVTADGNLKIEFDHIRSAFLIEEQRKRITNTSDNTSLQYDNDLFVIDCVPLAPSTKDGFSAVLQMKVMDNGHLQILNNNSNGDLGNFNWNLLGFGVGSQFFIEAGENIGVYTVFKIENTIIELVRVSGVTNFSGQAFITVSYFLTNVEFVNRTNEGFSFIDGIEGKNDYSNLRYSIKRNLEYWYPYLATATKYVQDLFIKNTSFEPNGGLITRLTSESVNVVDSGNISTTDISGLKILNPVIHSVKVYAGFEEVLQLIIDVRDIKGYCRVKLNDGRIIKGFIKSLEYTWATQELDLELEEKFESDVMTIESRDGGVYVKEFGYSEKSYIVNFELNGDYLRLVDAKEIELNNPIRFTNVTINGISFTDANLFSDAMQNIL